MAKEFVVWCDVCLNENDQRNTSQTTVVGLNGKTLGIDLCSEHQASLVAPLAAALTKYGEKQDDSVSASAGSPYRPAMPRKRGNFPCLLCEDTFSSNYTFVQHLAVVHGSKGPQWLFGDRCPVDGQTFKPGASLGAHISREHGDKGTSTAEVFMTVRRDGDQHGVVAERTAQAKAVLAQQEAEQ